MTEAVVGNIVETVKDIPNPVNQLYYLDLNMNQCGRIKVDNLEVEEDEAVGIFVKANRIIQGTIESKIGKVNDPDRIYTDYVRPFTLNIHLKETS